MLTSTLAANLCAGGCTSLARVGCESGKAVWAGVAQLVEHLICNQRVGGSNPFVSSKNKSVPVPGGFSKA